MTRDEIEKRLRVPLAELSMAVLSGIGSAVEKRRAEVTGVVERIVSEALRASRNPPAPT